MPDLITIPGIPQLWTHTKGDSRIKIAILDGAADLERACFKGANFTQFKPYWSEDIELNDEYFYYLKLAREFNQQQKAKKEYPDYDKDKAKKETEAFFAQFPEAIRRRIDLSSHATHIASTILGQHGSPVPGIAPHCTAINIPISYAGDDFISPINLTHAINEALKAGVNIIHIAACHPTQTGVSPDLFARAVKQCQENNILIIAPGGNDEGECWCIPAILPGVLTVGAMRDDGQPFKFSNYGGDYQTKGVMAHGENILGAEPGTDEPVRQKGTSCAAPIVTGISALLMSMQLQRGEQPNAEAVRQAILNSAIPCNPEEVEEPERCLIGKLNIPGALKLLTGEELLIGRPTQSEPKLLQQTRDYYNSMNPVIVQDVGTTYQAGLLKDSDDSARATNLFLASRAGIQPGDYILDAGCGVCGPAIDIAQNITEVQIEAITLSECQAETAKRLVEQAGLSERIRVHIGDYHKLPFADGVFDVVYFFESIEYTYSPQQLFLEVYRVLHSEGKLYIKGVFLKEHPLSEKEQQELAEFNRIYACQVRPITELREAILLAGFEDPETGDLSGVVSTDQFTKAMLASEDRASDLTEFGKYHYYEFQSAPIYFGEIKARKPTAPAIKTSLIGSSHQDLPAISNCSTTLITSHSTDNIAPSAASNLVYGLGTIGYDFGSEARRDSFKQLMPAVAIDGTLVPANPYDARQMVAYLLQNPSEAKALIWTLNQELTPVYVLEPRQGFSADIYETLIMMLAGQIELEDSDDFVERVSIPAKTTEKTVQLFSGQEIPVITVINTRGMYGWKVNSLVDAALGTVSSQQPQADEIAMRKSLTSFLNRVYYDFRNLGQFSKDRALNFSVTNVFQAASSFSEAVSRGMHLDTIEVEKSPFCRINSDCWDVILKFFDPENSRRAKKVYRFTVDVSDRLPVTLGEVRSWSVPK